MVEIRVENVTLVYHPNRVGPPPPRRGTQRIFGGYHDRAFVERLAGREEITPPPRGPIKALDNLSLTVRDGETMSIVGPSGCGKSTLLKVVAGLEQPDSGRVLYDGRDMSGVKPGERRIGMVFQNYALYPHMKGEGNLAFFFHVHHRPTEEMRERIRITSEIMGFGFDELLSRKPRTLSGGQQQRLAIGRCIVRDPALFLFDEPLSNLDAKLRVQTRTEIKRLLRRFGITAMYVTHDQTEAIALGDLIAVMRAGKIEQVGTYTQLHEWPANAFVAGFVGLPPMNLLANWQVVEGRLEGPYGHVEILPVWAPRLARGQRIILGFHTQSGQVSLAPLEPSSEELILRGQMLNREPDYARNQQRLHIALNGDTITAQAPLSLEIHPGQKVWIRVPLKTLYLFDEQTEKRLVP